MIRVLVRAIGSLLVSAFMGSIVVFLLLRMLKGDVATVILGQTATREALDALRDEVRLPNQWRPEMVAMFVYTGLADVAALVRGLDGVTKELPHASKL